VTEGARRGSATKGSDMTAPGPEAVAVPKPNRAGRDLRAAILVGVTLGAVVITTLFTIRVLWIGVICLSVGIGAYELTTALKAGGFLVPRIPVALAGAAVPAIAYAQGTDGLVLGFFVAVVVTLAWRAYDPRPGDLLRDLPACLFALGYTALLAGFAALLSQGPDGPRQGLIFIFAAVANDVGGYAFGVLSGGKHKLAPSVSPGKSWEGLAGSVVVACVFTGLAFPFLLHRSAGLGIVYGLAAVASATLGDLGESLLKRDLGIKDMGHLLPGHGGIMDRLDSLLASAPVAYLLLSVWGPVH
jgi:phosphatidate cytidylyltransferase